MQVGNKQPEVVTEEHFAHGTDRTRIVHRPFLGGLIHPDAIGQVSSSDAHGELTHSAYIFGIQRAHVGD